ncbi:MAG: Transrane secretion effector [Thermoplasmata archaeon]|jgi:MFS family permease|nr:Transrane secretion effector [Thermoplasmata archaeon]
MEPREAKRALAFATAAYVLGIIAQGTWLFDLAPLNLRAVGVVGADAWVFAASALSTMVCVVPAGLLADRVPRRHVMRAGLALLAVSYAPLLAPPSLATTVLTSALSGAGLALLATSFNSYVADLLHGASMAKGYGATGALSVLASALGPLAAAQLFASAPDLATGLRWNALLFAAVALTGAALTWPLPTARPPTSRARLAGSRFRLDGAIVPVAALYVFAGFSFGITTPYFAVRFLDLGTTPDQWGLALGLATAAGALGFWLAGRLAARWPAGPLLVASQALAALALLPFLWTNALAPLLVGFVLRYVFASAIAPLANTMMMGRVDPGGRGFAQGFASMTWNAGWSAGALAGGPLLSSWGGALFPAGAAVAVAGALVALALASRGPAPAPELPAEA